MEIRNTDVHADLVIAGAGMSGICAAIQASRLGLKVVLINDRGYLGGNSSAEINVSIDGAEGVSEFNLHSRSGGIIDEILFEMLYKTPEANHYIWDGVLNDYMINEGIEVYSNTYIDKVEKDKNEVIVYISGAQNTTETRFNFYATTFIDNTGDGVIGFLAGSKFLLGRESKHEFDEDIASEEGDNCVIPSTLSFYARDMGKKTQYISPDFAVDLTIGDTLKNRTIPHAGFWHFQWFYEVGARDLSQIYDGQTIIEKHRELVYGIWDYIKNSGQYPEADNFDLMYVAAKPGKREGRRLVGKYILKQQDITEQTDFEDTVGHGGWSIDLHAIEGFFSKDFYNAHYCLRGVFKIPYRVCVSNDINNLFMIGRCMSTTHVAFGATRVNATLSTIGQAAGAAAYLCKKYNITPSEVYEKGKFKELQQILLKYDQLVLGVKNIDENDLAINAKIEVSSSKKVENTKQEDIYDLNRAAAISLPVDGLATSLSVLIKTEKDTVLKYKLYKSSKQENYDPAEVIMENEVSVKANSEFQWVELPINMNFEKGYIFAQLEINEDITLAITNNTLAGTTTLIRTINTYKGMLDVYSKEVMDFFWKSVPFCICFKLNCQSDIYGGHNVNNGFSRPYIQPNIWVSDNKVNGEFIKIKLNDEKELKELFIKFDANFEYRTISHPNNKFNVMPQIVKAYDVSYLDKDKYIKIAEIRGNYKRQNTIDLNGITTNEIKIDFIETNGCESVGVYEIRLY